VGRLVIPYLDMAGVYGLKFRCIVHDDCKSEGCAKYLSLPGQETSVYGVVDADSTSSTVHVTEGEFDRLIIRQVFNEPCLGIPGVSNWKPHFPFFFGGFERVLMWPDGDKAGEDLANRVSKSVRGVEVMPIPRGMDVTSYYLAQGAKPLISMAGGDENED
jgi:DNA primase